MVLSSTIPIPIQPGRFFFLSPSYPRLFIFIHQSSRMTDGRPATRCLIFHSIRDWLGYCPIFMEKREEKKKYFFFIASGEKLWCDDTEIRINHMLFFLFARAPHFHTPSTIAFFIFISSDVIAPGSENLPGRYSSPGYSSFSKRKIVDYRGSFVAWVY